MASRVVVEFTDDLNGKPADETVTFGLDGSSYEIDLTSKNAASLRKAFQPWQESARRTGGAKRGKRSGSGGNAKSAVDTKAVRAWAASNGFELSPRGRLPKDVVEKFHAAGN
jgi:nucleoid-associated protein Lsr2